MTDDLRDRIAKAAISAFCYTTPDHVIIEVPGDASINRREQWVSRATADEVADAVLDAIAKTHELVPIATAAAIRAFIDEVGSEAPWFGSEGWEIVATWFQSSPRDSAGCDD